MVSVAQGKKVSIRNPNATRPWQHVLEPLSGYLQIGQKILEEKAEFGETWNFGPSDEGDITVEKVVKNIKIHWDKIVYEINEDPNQFHEASLLKLDCSKAHMALKWQSVWDSQTTFKKTVNWYKAFYENQKNNFSIHPNPIISSAQIEFRLDTKASVKVLDLQGKLVRSYHVGSGTSQVLFERGDLQSGIYLVSIETKDFIEMKKILIQ